jgi:hypothetical protein
MKCNGEHLPSKRKTLHPAMSQDLLDAASPSPFKACIILFLLLSVGSISARSFFPVGATCHLQVSWQQLLACFSPGNRSALPDQKYLLELPLKAFIMLAAGNIITTSIAPLLLAVPAQLQKKSLLLNLRSSPYTFITSTGNKYDRSQNKFKQILPYITAYYINTTILYCHYSHCRLIQHSCHQPPQHGYHQHLQHGLGQHIQHDDREEESPPGIQELLKYLQRNKNTRFCLTQ